MLYKLMEQKSLHALNEEDFIHPEAAIIYLIKNRHSYLAYRSKQPLTYPDTNPLPDISLATSVN